MALGIFGYALSQTKWLLFSAVPAGNCNGSSFNNAWNRNLNYNNANVNRNNNKNNGRSVRCLRD